jgi:membrane protease YdiL (CAAX protease family)
VATRGGIGLVLTSVAFALLHEPVPTSAGIAPWLGGLAMYTGMGACFGAVYLGTGRFRASFLAHAACNATALVVAAYSAS